MNVRQLGHAIENAVLMTDGDCIDIGDLPCHQDAIVEANLYQTGVETNLAAKRQSTPECGAVRR
ncbi:hypothetical protein [Candidatus Binatus sp.]|uniref:hypothetical protein n=1 Tax=Candidatus Binatus sp. TaxID=2811406 RepID=UPI003BB1C4A1